VVNEGQLEENEVLLVLEEENEVLLVLEEGNEVLLVD
jgi:hypothetical protein